MLNQLLLNVVIAGAVYAMIGAGFGLVLQLTRCFNFAYGLTFVWGGYAALLCSMSLHQPLPHCVILGVLFAVLVGSMMELWIFRPLRRRGATPMVCLLASLGVYVVGQNIISLLFGDGVQSMRTSPAVTGVDILGGKITPLQLMTVGISVAVLTTIMLALKMSKAGKMVAATSGDPELALTWGIPAERVVVRGVALGSGVAGLAGVLTALDVGLTPTMGMRALMMGMVVVLIGGIRSIPGTILGALFLGLAQQVGVFLTNSQWRDTITFVVLLVFMLVRPQGFLGTKPGKAVV